MSGKIEWSKSGSYSTIHPEKIGKVTAPNGKQYRAKPTLNCCDCAFSSMFSPCNDRQTLPCETGDLITIDGKTYRMERDTAWEKVT